jgi:hypothetical protein
LPILTHTLDVKSERLRRFPQSSFKIIADSDTARKIRKADAIALAAPFMS